MFNIKLYKFNKKINSTKRPRATDGTAFSCLMKTETSLLNPVVDIKAPNPDNIPFYNYAYIEEFKRYYFINDITYNLGIWNLYLSVDVLASFQEDILNSRQYVIRSASQSNPFIIDTLYKTYRDNTSSLYYRGSDISTVYRQSSLSGEWSPVSYFDQTVSTGAFLVGVVGGTATGVTYYIMTRNAFESFLTKTFSINPSDMSDVSTGVANALFNPLQYITTCRWYPLRPFTSNTGGEVRYVKVGGYTVDFGVNDSGCFILNTTSVEKYRFTADLPVHPQWSTDCEYLNYAPYTEINLYFQPFGVIPIDTTKVQGSDRIKVQWTVDFCGGVCSLEILNNSNDGLIYTDIAEYGVPLPISTLVYDWKAGLLLSGLTFLKQQYTKEPTASVMNNPQYANAINAGIDVYRDTTNTDLIDKAMDVSGATLGQLSTKGAQGSFLAYMLDLPHIFAWFTLVAEENNSKYGRPLYKNVRLDNLSGFTLCSNATVDYSTGTPIEIEKSTIKSLLNSGIFVEF